MIHIAILMKQYLDLVLSGEKTVECRLTMQARAPFDAIEPGERIYFKQSAGPYRAMAVADEVLFEEDLSPTRVRQLKKDYNDLILGDDYFWKLKANSRFATLVWLDQVREIDTGPAIRPLQGVAWLSLADEPAWRRRDHYGCSFTIPITDGNIRNNTLYVGDLCTHFPASALGGKTKQTAGKPFTLALHDGPTVKTDIVGPRKMFRTRVWGKWFRANDAKPGDRVVFQPAGDRCWHVGLVKGRGERSEGDPSGDKTKIIRHKSRIPTECP